MTNSVILPVGPPPADTLGLAGFSVSDGKIVMVATGVDPARELILQRSTDLVNWSEQLRITPTGHITVVEVQIEQIPRLFHRLAQEEYSQ